MTVYVVEYSGWEWSTVRGVFSTPELAANEAAQCETEALGYGGPNWQADRSVTVTPFDVDVSYG